MKMPWPNTRLLFFSQQVAFSLFFFVVFFFVDVFETLLLDHFWRLNEKSPASKECYAPHAMYQPLLPDLEPKTLPSAPCFFFFWQNF